jgi:hypothetical protein
MNKSIGIRTGNLDQIIQPGNQHKLRRAFIF